MGGPNVEVDFTKIEQAGKDLDQFSKDLKDAVEKMEGKVGDFGEPWGGDELGMLIGITHEVVSLFKFDKLKELVEDLDADSKAAKKIAADLRGDQDESVKLIKKSSEV